jgi:hypothetical protein
MMSGVAALPRFSLLGREWVLPDGAVTIALNQSSKVPGSSLR